MTQHSAHILTAEQLANYVVCPEAWRLKHVDGERAKRPHAPQESKRVRREWVERQDLSSKLRSYAKVAYLLLVALVVIVFLLDYQRSQRPTATEVVQTSIEKSVPTEIMFLLLILGLIIFLWDLFERKSTSLRADSGLEKDTEVLSLRGGSYKKGKQYLSTTLGLSSTPDAIVREDNHIIPVDIKPSSNKVRDRHVIALLTHLRLIEEEHGKRPPYGILLMGKEQRRVVLEHSDEKRRWLEAVLAEMRSIIDGVPAVPAPAKYKCKHCDVKEICEHKA